MSSNRVNVTLTATDLVSPDLATIRSRLDTLGARASIRLSVSQLTGANFGNIQAGLASIRGEATVASGNLSTLTGLLVGLGVGTALASIQLATQGFQSLTGAIASAAKTQTQFIAASSDIGTNLGVPLSTAKKLNSELQEEVAKTAAALPGTTQDYNIVLQAISGTLASQFKGNPEAFKQVSLDVTKRTGTLAAIQGSNPAQAGSTMNRFISGTMSMGEASVNDILQKNPQLIAAINKESAKLGVDVKKWKTLQTSTRLAIVQAALRTATPDSLIAEFDGTVESMWQTWQTKLFDPQIGLLGMLRKVKSKGSRTVLDSVQGLMQAIDGLANLGGTGFDPLVPIINFIDWISDLANGLNGLSAGLSGMSTKTIGKAISGTLNGLATGINTAMAKINYPGLGKQLWKGLLATLDTLASVLANLDWVALGKALLQGLYRAFEVLVGFLYEAIKDLGYAIKAGFNNAVSNATSDIGRVTGIVPSTPKQAVQSLGTIGANVATSITPPGLPGILLNIGKTGYGLLKGKPKPVADTTDNTSTTVKPVVPTPSPLPLATPGANKQASNRIFSPTINIPNGSNSSPTEIAQSVINALSSMYQSFESGQLA